MKKKDKYLFLLTLILVIIWFLGNGYFSEVNIYQPIKISINGLNNSESKEIKINCITPNNHVYKLPFNNGLWKGNYAFNKYLSLYIPDTFFTKISDIIVFVGNYKYTFNPEKFKKEWELIKEDNRSQNFYKSPQYLTGDTSFFKMLFSIYYWGGYFPYLLFSIITLIIIFIFYFLYFLKYKKYPKPVIGEINNMLKVKKELKINQIFYIAFGFSLICSLTVLFTKGFGWDGDSFTSAAQFIKLINPDLYGVSDGGVFPKIFSILFFGVNYWVFGNFYVMTFIALLFNSYMIAILCRWIFDLGGDWVIALLTLSINLSWLWLVCGCDSPAFNLPLVIIGLYYYFHKSHKKTGTWLIVCGDLFRPGGVPIILFLILFELWKRNKRIIHQLLALIITVSHTIWGYLLAYPTKAELIRQCFERLNYEPQYHYSFNAIFPYILAIKSIIFDGRYLTLLIFLPSLAGLFFIFKNKKNILFILLTLLTTLLIPMLIFLYGYNLIQVQYFIIFSIVMCILTAFCQFDFFSVLSKNIKVILTYLFLFSLIFVYLSVKNANEIMYEVNPDGSGAVQWIQCKDIYKIIKKDLPKGYQYKALIPNEDKIFFILDCGLNAKKVTIVGSYNSPDKIKITDIENKNFDIVLLEKNSEIESSTIESLGYNKYIVVPGRYLFVKKNISDKKYKIS